MLTGTLGTADSQPGKVQPGYHCTGIAEWHGPFPWGEGVGYDFGAGNPIKILGPGSFQVPLNVASRMADADHAWWVFH